MKKKIIILLSIIVVGMQVVMPISAVDTTGIWMKDSVGWWYNNTDGTYPYSCWKLIDNEWYYFNDSGYMVTGWQFINGNWYYFTPSGAMASNQWIGNYYVGADGVMLTNTWIGEYYVGADGKWIPGYQPAGWVNSGGRWWYRHNDGSYTTNDWEFIDGQWYYFDASGWMLSSQWIQSGSNWYYLTASGAMATSQWVGECYVDMNGVWIPGYGNGEHVHTWKVEWETLKSGYACNGCLTDVTDWDNKYACHGGWHSHQWWLTPYTETCTTCGALRHLHEWYWREPDYYVGTDEIASGNYYICYRCGHKSLDGQDLVQELREKYWISGFDFSNTSYILGVKYVEEKSDPMKLCSIRVNHKTIPSNNLVIGDELDLSVTYTPASTNQKGVTWSSSDSFVLKVDANGKLTAVGEGTATIEIRSIHDVNKKGTYTFNVFKDREGEVKDAWIVIDGQKIENNGTFVCKEGGWINGQKEVKHHEVYVETNPNPAKYRVKYNFAENEEFADDDVNNYYVMRLSGSSQLGNVNQYTNSEDTISEIVTRDAGKCTFSIDIIDVFGKKITLNVNVIVEEK